MSTPLDVHDRRSVPPGGSGVVRRIAYVVAASDSSDLDKAGADAVCTGVNDHLVFRAAVTALLTRRGVIFACAGTYHMSSSVEIPGGISLVGAGWGSDGGPSSPRTTTFRIATDYGGQPGIPACLLGQGYQRFSDFQMEAVNPALPGPSYALYARDGSVVERVYVRNATSHGMFLDSRATVRSCRIGSINAASVAAWVGALSLFEDTRINDAVGTGIVVMGQHVRIHAVDLVFVSRGISVGVSCAGVRITHSRIVKNRNVAASGSAYGINFDSSTQKGALISGCWIDPYTAGYAVNVQGATSGRVLIANTQHSNSVTGAGATIESASVLQVPA